MSGMMLRQCCCGGAAATCWYKWIVTWDCETSSWGTVTLDDSDCGTAPGSTSWTWESATATTCTYTIYVQSEVSCTSIGDCSGQEGSAPDAPAAPDANCDCYTYGLPPCDYCNDTQPNATITARSAEDCPCRIYSGDETSFPPEGGADEFTFSGYGEWDGMCVWAWYTYWSDCSSGIYLYVAYDPSTSTWASWIEDGIPIPPETWFESADAPNCVGGVLTGVLSFTGTGDCAGETLEVTLGA